MKTYFANATTDGLRIEKDITSNNSFTEPGIFDFGAVAVSITIPTVGTVTIQKSSDDGNTWKDVEQWTESTECLFLNLDRAQVRIGCKSGDYDSGTINVILWQAKLHK